MKTNELARILVVDDDEWITCGARAALESPSFEILTAADGMEGLASALYNKPDLIITDVVMPRMDGWTLARNLRSNPDFGFVPILFLTSRGGAQDRISGFQLGADDYIAKPLNMLELPRRVMRALAQRRRLEAEFAAPPDKAPGGTRLSGSLDQVGMACLLSILCQGRRSGILRLAGVPGQAEILLYLVRGQVYRAEVEGRGRLASGEVRQHLFGWLRGTFEFAPMRIRLADELELSTTALLMEGARSGTLLETSA